MGLFNPGSREEQAHSIYCENARFQEILRGNKRKIGNLTTPDFGLSDKTWTDCGRASPPIGRSCSRRIRLRRILPGTQIPKISSRRPTKKEPQGLLFVGLSDKTWTCGLYHPKGDLNIFLDILFFQTFTLRQKRPFALSWHLVSRCSNRVHGRVCGRKDPLPNRWLLPRRGADDFL